MHNTPIQKYIYSVLCDTSEFKTGTSYTSREISDKVYSYTQMHNPDALKECSREEFNHNVRQVLQTRNNTVNNVNRQFYIDSNSMLRDISAVKKDNRRNLYTFGRLYNDNEPIR